VSLHSHTHYSRESLSFIFRQVARAGCIDFALRHSPRQGPGFDLRRGWWTPPLVPEAAWRLECRQIAAGFGLEPLVSLTDHDSIEASLELRASGLSPGAPVSVEWTVPAFGSVLHLGVHNLPPDAARPAMSAMERFTRRPDEDELGSLLEWLHTDPGVLIVFNHPLWDENRCGGPTHRRAGETLLSRLGSFIDALELNGLRPWPENARVEDLARAWDKPVVSGGDRHGLEPSAMLNLTGAATFAEFVDEVRRDGRSEILVAPQYRQPLFWRMFDAVLDALGDHEHHGLGWKTWNQRIFCPCDDGIVRSLRQLWGDRAPAILGAAAAAARALHHRRLQWQPTFHRT
jgi:hypothetical protein